MSDALYFPNKENDKFFTKIFLVYLILEFLCVKIRSEKHRSSEWS